MRKGYNHELAVNIQIEKERRELEIEFDVHGNVKRDHAQEIRILSESETKNSLTEVPVAFFDGCKRLSEHIRDEKTLPVVRRVRLAPLSETTTKESIKRIIFNFLDRKLSYLLKRNTNELPTFNKEDESKKVWAYNNMIKKYSFTGKK